ncbi:MAG: MFS transporter [Firmicutes bacterium]|nr:MFS transporter [Bacillota bacterium]
MDAKVKPTIGVLTAVPFIMVLGNSMLIPVLPAIQKALDVSLLQVGLLITAFSIPAGLTIPFAGMLSDHVGRKIVMVPALIVYGAGGLLAGFAALLFKENAYPYILGSRIIQGIGAGGTYQLAMALSGDLIQDRERAQALGLLEAANGLGKVVSPLAGAAIALIAWYMPFFAYGILALPIALAILFVAKEGSAKQKGQPLASYFTNLLQILKDKGVNLGIAFLCGLIVLFSLFGLLSYFSDQLEKAFHLQTFHRGLVIAVPVLAMAVTSYLFGIVLKKRMVKIMKGTILGGLALVALGLFCFPLGNGIVAKTIFATLIGAGTGMALPALNTLITSSAPTSERGLVTCLYGTVRFFGVAIGPPLFSFATKYGTRLIFWSDVGCVAVIAALAFFLIQPQQILPENLKGGGGQNTVKK